MVCGCGRSLNELSSTKGYITIGVNDVGRQFDPDYLVVLNPRHQFRKERFRYIESSGARAIFTQLQLSLGQRQVVQFRLGQFNGTDFSNPNVLHYTRNSPYVALCLAIHMGAKRIGLIGVDFTDDHFFQKSGRHPLASGIENINREYAALADACRRLGIEIYNLSAQSRITAFEKMPLSRFERFSGNYEALTGTADAALNIVSYSMTPIAGVPDILARCIASDTTHNAVCVWGKNGFGNGVSYRNAGIVWAKEPARALDALAKADLYIVHNGKVCGKHRRWFNGKPVITLAHNYLWNVDETFVNQGWPGLVVAQYQATLPEFQSWLPVPNPIPLFETDFLPSTKNTQLTICYTPSGKHEKYPVDHRLYWHAKGYNTTMRVLDALARRYPIELEVIRARQLPHAQVLQMKQRAHIVIDECVTGGYHRNSLEGLAAGCVVVNGFGLLPGMREVFSRCIGAEASIPFISCDLGALEATLSGLIERGADELIELGLRNRQWMERYWSFSDQWRLIWEPAVQQALERAGRGYRLPPPENPVSIKCKTVESDCITTAIDRTGGRTGVSVVIPHKGRDRLPNLLATLNQLKRCNDVNEIIVVESDKEPTCREFVQSECDKYVFVASDGMFRRGHALNIGSGVAEYEFILWLDNDLLMRDGFIRGAVQEIHRRNLDFLVPYAAIHYLSETDSRSVIKKTVLPEHCKVFKTLRSGRDVIGGSGLVTRKFFLKCGGFEKDFRGWGGEDNAWHHKARLFGRMAVSARSGQVLYHLYHDNSGANSGGVSGIQSNPCYRDNLALLNRIRRIKTADVYSVQFPCKSFHCPWSETSELIFIVDSAFLYKNELVEPLVSVLREIYGLKISLVSWLEFEQDYKQDYSVRPANSFPAAFVIFSSGVNDNFSDVNMLKFIADKAVLVLGHSDGIRTLEQWLQEKFAAIVAFNQDTFYLLRNAKLNTSIWPHPIAGKDINASLTLIQAISIAAGRQKDHISSISAKPQAQTALVPTVWLYWEGFCPDWIRECHKTIFRHAPDVRLLDAEAFDGLWYSDRDIDISRLPLALKADFIRMYLLSHYGGLWIDSDCLIMQPLQPLLEKVKQHEFVAHRERSGLVSNGFIGARPGSRIAERYYAKICEILRSGQRLCWTSLGSQPLTAILNESDKLWYELKCERVQPVCWSEPQRFFERTNNQDHLRKWNSDAICYMLSNDQLKKYKRKFPRKNLLQQGTFFRFLLERALEPAAGFNGDEGAVIRGGKIARVNGYSMSQVFEELYKNNVKAGGESLSGPGSGLTRTQHIRLALPKLFSEFGINSVLDAPCGDFHWFKEIVTAINHYIGIDIVRQLIIDNRARYSSGQVEFLQGDISIDILPNTDMIFSRDCLTHMPFEDIFVTLQNFKQSGARYLILTTFMKDRVNSDIKLGDWRPLNFMRRPFEFPDPLVLINEHCDELRGRYADKSLALWEMNKIPV